MKPDMEHGESEVDQKRRDPSTESSRSELGGMPGCETEERGDAPAREPAEETQTVSLAGAATAGEDNNLLTKAEDGTLVGGMENGHPSPDSSASECQTPGGVHPISDNAEGNELTTDLASVLETNEQGAGDGAEAKFVSAHSSSTASADSSSHPRSGDSGDGPPDSQEPGPSRQTSVASDHSAGVDEAASGGGSSPEDTALRSAEREEGRASVSGVAGDCVEGLPETGTRHQGEKAGELLSDTPSFSSSQEPEPALLCSVAGRNNCGAKGFREEDMREVIRSLDRDSLESMVRRIQRSVVCLMAEEKHIQMQQTRLLQERRELDEQVASASKALQECKSRQHAACTGNAVSPPTAARSYSSASVSCWKPSDATRAACPPQSLSAPCARAFTPERDEVFMGEVTGRPSTEDEEMTRVGRHGDSKDVDLKPGNGDQEEREESEHTTGENLDILENLIVKYGPAAVKTVETAANKMRTGISVLRHELAVMQRHNRAVERHRQLERRAKLRFLCEERLELTHRQRLLQHLGAHHLTPGNPAQQLPPNGAVSLDQVRHGAVVLMPGGVCTLQQSPSPTVGGSDGCNDVGGRSTVEEASRGECSVERTGDVSGQAQTTSSSGGEALPPLATSGTSDFLSVQSTSIGTSLSPISAASRSSQTALHPLSPSTLDPKLMKAEAELQHKKASPILPQSQQSGFTASDIPSYSPTRLRSGSGGAHTPRHLPEYSVGKARIVPSRPRAGSAAVVLGTRRQRLESAVKSLSSATPGASLENLSKGVATAVGTAKSNLTRWLFGGEGEQATVRGVAPLPFAGATAGEDRRKQFKGLTESQCAAVDPNTCLLQPEKLIGEGLASCGGESRGSLGISAYDEDSTRTSREPHPSQVFDLATPTSDHCSASAYLTSPSHEAHVGEDPTSVVQKSSGESADEEAREDRPDCEAHEGEDDAELVPVIEGVVCVQIGPEDVRSIKIVVSATEQCSTAAETWVRENWEVLSQAQSLTGSQDREPTGDCASESTVSSALEDKKEAKGLCVSQETAVRVLSDHLARVEAESQELPVKVDIKWNALVGGELE